MKSKLFKQMIWLAMFAVGVVLAQAAEPTLKVGDAAPKLQTGKWVQGEPVKEFEKGKAYIVEFWATWCGPCRATIPHLNELHEKYKDKGLVVIGQNCWENDESKVAPFIKQMGEKMTYRVALDNKEGSERGKMSDTWMAAAGRNGIPSAFLVDKKGSVAWIGHPMQLKEKTIEDVLAGTFNVSKAAADFERAQKNEAALGKAYAGAQQAMREKNWAEAESKIAELNDLLPEDDRGMLDTLRLNVLFGKEDYKAAYELAGKVSAAHANEPMFQNELAWQIATDPKIKQRDLKLAETIANRANESSKGKDPAILDTVARVKYLQGKKDEALALQQKAISLADGDMKAQLEKTLEEYKTGELSKTN